MDMATVKFNKINVCLMTPLWPKLLCSDILTHSKVCTNPEHLQAHVHTRDRLLRKYSGKL